MGEEKQPMESNFDYCERVARDIPPEKLLIDILRNLSNICARSKTKTLQGELQKLLYHGNGVRRAIVRRYLGAEYDK